MRWSQDSPFWDGGKLSVLAYFRSPFPSTKGFSPYRMPGVSVHAPVFSAFLLVGISFCVPHPALRPLLLVWIVAGLYLGRDIAIYCHYAPLLTLVSWAGATAVFIKLAAIGRFGASHFGVSAAASASLAALLLLAAAPWTRYGGDER